jgi:DNA-binding NarL/FixJ family response regulator
VLASSRRFCGFAAGVECLFENRAHGKPECEVLDAMADVVALIDDLFFQAKVIETAKHLGIDLRICGTPDALLAEIGQHTPGLIIVDLNARSEPLGAIERLPAGAREIPLVAFLSHVQTELAAKARAAGCREVIPRSLFTQNLATILTRAKSQAS